MTEQMPMTTMDTLEDVPHFDPDPGKIHEQAEKQAANIDGLIRRGGSLNGRRRRYTGRDQG